MIILTLFSFTWRWNELQNSHEVASSVTVTMVGCIMMKTLHLRERERRSGDVRTDIGTHSLHWSLKRGAFESSSSSSPLGHS